MLDLVPNRAVPIEGTKGVERKLVGGGGHGGGKEPWGG